MVHYWDTDMQYALCSSAYLYYYLSAIWLLVEPMLFLSAWDPKAVQKAETNGNNEQTRNGFHSHFNGIAIRVTLMWQPSSVWSRPVRQTHKKQHLCYILGREIWRCSVTTITFLFAVSFSHSLMHTYLGPSWMISCVDMRISQCWDSCKCTLPLSFVCSSLRWWEVWNDCCCELKWIVLN